MIALIESGGDIGRVGESRSLNCGEGEMSGLTSVVLESRLHFASLEKISCLVHVVRAENWVETVGTFLFWLPHRTIASEYEQTTINALKEWLPSRWDMGYGIYLCDAAPMCGEPVLFERRREAPFASYGCGVMGCAEIGLMSPVAVLLCPEAECVSIPDRNVWCLGDRTGETEPLLLYFDLSGSSISTPPPLADGVCKESCEFPEFGSVRDDCEFSTKE